MNQAYSYFFMPSTKHLRASIANIEVLAIQIESKDSWLGTTHVVTVIDNDMKTD